MTSVTNYDKIDIHRSIFMEGEIMSKWKIDPDHSVAAFSVRHLMIANVRGQFNKINGTISFDPDEPGRSALDVVIDLKSITTGIRKRDDHLLSPDFLDAERHPMMVFRSKKTGVAAGNRLRVTGDLSIHGITRLITVDAEYFGPVKSPFGGEITMGFSTSFSINRDDFGITWNEVMEDGGLMIDKELQISIDLEADRIE